MERQSAKILIVEDNPTDREFYERILSKNTLYQFKFIHADLGEEGLECYRHNLPDCILLDYNLPDIDGIEFLSAVQEVTSDYSIPITVMLTGQGTPSIAVEAIRRGAKDYLVKGMINQDMLNNAINDALDVGHIHLQTSIPKHSILMIENNKCDRKLYKRLLREASHNRFDFIEVKTGSEGIDYVHRENPDCILLDYDLPDFDGLEFIAELNKEHYYHKLPQPVVVMLSQQGSESVAVEAMKRGVSDYLVKSDISREVLYRSVTNALETRSLRVHLENKKKEFELFTYAVSHDLQAPLRRGQQFCDMLKEQTAGQLNLQAQQYLDYIDGNFSRLQQLIKGLLAYYSIDKLKETLSEVDVNEVVSIALLNLDEQVRKLSPNIQVYSLPHVLGHKATLVHLFQNLLQNAMKFNRHQDINIQISATQTANHWKFCVADNGIGIDQKKMDIIFNAFQRLHSEDEFEGSGLGLAICQKIVKYHNGNIWGESTQGNGSQFYFTLLKA